MTQKRKLPQKRDKQARSFAQSTIVSIVLSICFLALSALLAVNSVKAISTAHQRSLLLDTAEVEVQDLRLRNLELQEELGYVMSSSYIEQEARNRLLYTKNGEVLLMLPETGGEAKGESTEMNDAVIEKVDDLEGWMRWWELFRDGV